MIELSNGHKIEYMAASAAFGFDGKTHRLKRPLQWFNLFDPSLFTTKVIKTLTRLQQKGNFRWYNPLRVVKPIKGGVHNAVGLTNNGIDWFCEHIGPKIDKKKNALVVSIHSDNIEELGIMAGMLNDFAFVALEINVSCPNVRDYVLSDSLRVVEACQEVEKNSCFPIILKLSVVQDIRAILPRIQGLVEAISINSVPWRIVFPNCQSSLKRFGGGALSGKIAQPFTWKFARKIVEMKNNSIPVIWPSMWQKGDIEKAREQGAQAFSFCSVFFLHPWRATKLIRNDIKQRKKYVH